jgi:hypothetical protein
MDNANLKKNWQEPLRIAIIYAADGVVDPQEMMNHRKPHIISKNSRSSGDKSDAFLQFLSDMNISLPLKTDGSYLFDPLLLMLLSTI